MDIDLWNAEDEEQLALNGAKAAKDLVVFSRDWTVETLCSQVKQGNIIIDPSFQRRHVWTDARRSALIESILIKFPIPQIVIAEHPEKPKSFIVIDGKQRISTLASLELTDQRTAWDEPVLSGLRVLRQLNGTSLEELMSLSKHADERRALMNSDIRTTIITNYKDEKLLYSIFYRLNTTSTPLSSQELRHALLPGEFANFLTRFTSAPNAVWRALGLDGPDSRLRDAELLLRLLGLRMFANRYQGNLREFLDQTMRTLNSQWIKEKQTIETEANQIADAINAACEIFGSDIGRKFVGDQYESRFNRAVFEVQAFSLIPAKVRAAAVNNTKKVRAAYERLCEKSPDFLESIATTTKSVGNFRTRFGEYSKMLSTTIGIKVTPPEFSK